MQIGKTQLNFQSFFVHINGISFYFETIREVVDIACFNFRCFFIHLNIQLVRISVHMVYNAILILPLTLVYISYAHKHNSL